MLLGGQQRRPAFLQVGHGLDGDQVGLGTGLDDLGKDIHRLFEAQGADGLQQLADGPHVQSDQGPVAGGFPCHFEGGRHHFLHALAGAAQLFPVGAEGVGVDDLAARVHVGAVDITQPVRVIDGGQLRAGIDRYAPGLQQSAHAAVQNHRAFLFQQFTKVHSVLLLCGNSSPRRRGSLRSAAPPPVFLPDRDR